MYMVYVQCTYLVDGLLHSVHVHIMIAIYVHELLYMLITKVSIQKYIIIVAQYYGTLTHHGHN